MRHNIFWYRVKEDVQVTKEVFKAAGGRLKVVGRAGVGVDNVDLASATDMSLPQVHCTQLAYMFAKTATSESTSERYTMNSPLRPHPFFLYLYSAIPA